MNIQKEMDNFLNKEIADLLENEDLDYYAKEIQNYNDLWHDDKIAFEDFRADEIEGNPDLIDILVDDIGNFTDKYCGEDILNYLLEHYSEEEINEKLEEIPSDYTVDSLKEIFAEKPCDNETTYVISFVWYWSLIETDYLDRTGFNFMEQILTEYSYQVCRALGYSDNEILRH